MGHDNFFHPEEYSQFGVVWDYDNEHSDAVYEIAFPMVNVTAQSTSPPLKATTPVN
ncbi:hypothetical protein ACTFPK_03170 [Actinotignum sp. UMB0459]|uniref:hypothetical protein n=1 Tax=Actinotignum sp. UMB0459 TaxID=3449314 RepID=UPI003F76A133